MKIEKEINGRTEVKEIFEKDLSYFISRGWKISDKKEDVPVKNKKGRKRSFIIEDEQE